MDLTGTMMGVWAHPDDEAFLSAGLMAEAVTQGRRVVCVTATRGELGIQDPVRWPPELLAGIREVELARSLAELGVTEHHYLGYPDGGCEDVDTEEAVGAVARLIAEIAPAHIFTFGPEGMTGHPDHKTISAWTSEAFDRAAPPGARLYHAVVTADWMDTHFKALSDAGAFYLDVYPPVVPNEDLAIDFELPPPLAAQKWAALVAQESQTAGLIKVLGEDIARGVNSSEYFVLAASK